MFNIIIIFLKLIVVTFWQKNKLTEDHDIDNYKAKIISPI